jgi:ATP-dependent Clp protease adaptor protein ClpS
MSFQILPDIDTHLDQQLSQEPPYRIIIHNDDVTPMDFVMHILRSVFLLDSLRALQVMYTAHYHGSAYVQTLPRPEAHKRVGNAHISASLNGYPLHFTVEAE